MEAENRGALVGFFEASMWDLPLALQKWMLGMGEGSHGVEEAVLKTCQAWITLANESVERLYQAEGFVGLMTASVKNFVQCQRVARNFIESVAPGLGSAKGEGCEAQSAELREALRKLQRDLRQLSARVNLLDRGVEAQNGIEKGGPGEASSA
jgi:hypothetical protein